MNRFRKSPLKGLKKITQKKFFRISLLLAVVATSAAYFEWNRTRLDPSSAKFEIYREGFLELVEKEIGKNSAASEPELYITEIRESFGVLRIQYILKYNESFGDGEHIARETTGTAVLKKGDSTSTQNEGRWFVQQIQNAKQTLNFSKGSFLGS